METLSHYQNNFVELQRSRSLEAVFQNIATARLKPGESPENFTSRFLDSNGGMLKSLGLSVVPQETPVKLDENLDPSPIKVILTGKIFTKFLKIITPEDVSQLNLLAGLQKIAKDLSDQIINSGKYKDSSSLLAENRAYVYALGIADRYQQLGLVEEASQLRHAFSQKEAKLSKPKTETAKIIPFPSKT